MNQTERPGATLCRIVGLILFLCSLSYQREASGQGRERGSSTVRLETPFKTPLRCSSVIPLIARRVYSFKSRNSNRERSPIVGCSIRNQRRSKGINLLKRNSLSLLKDCYSRTCRGKFAQAHRIFFYFVRRFCEFGQIYIEKFMK